jgi:hypothetical protein
MPGSLVISISVLGGRPFLNTIDSKSKQKKLLRVDEIGRKKFNLLDTWLFLMPWIMEAWFPASEKMWQPGKYKKVMS